jgi:hypothetical protein
MNLLFTSDSRPRTISAADGILRAQAASRRLKGDYPGHEDWLANTLAQLRVGRKSLVLATLDDRPIATGIYQLHPTDPTMVELRNVAVKGPESQRPLIVQSLVNTVALAASVDFPHASLMIGDTKSTNEELIAVMQGVGWSIVGTTTLISEYGSNGVPDTVMMRELPGRHRASNFIMPRFR